MMEEVVKPEIVFQPIKKLIIFQLMELSNSEFFKRIGLFAGSEQPIVLNWAEGVLFIGMPYESNSEKIIDEGLKGTRYLEIMIFTCMAKYEPSKRLGVREIPIIDQTADTYLSQVAKWLKERIKIEAPIR
jgi:hypothetical protein